MDKNRSSNESSMQIIIGVISFPSVFKFWMENVIKNFILVTYDYDFVRQKSFLYVLLYTMKIETLIITD